MFRLAGPDDFDQLAELWDLGFPGEARFGRFIFERFPDTQNIMVAEEDKALLAMLLMLPRSLVSPEGRFEVSYIMGVTTRPEARGKGIMQKLMHKTHETLTGRGLDMAVLIPAEPSLFDYYARLGYSPFFEVQRRELRPPPLPRGYRVDRLSEDTPLFDNIYRSALGRAAYLERSAEDWLCAMDEHRKFEGEVLLIYKDDLPVSYAFFGQEKGKLKISEALGLNNEHTEAALAAVFSHTGAKTAELVSPSAGSGQPFGSALALSQRGQALLKSRQELPPYINLMHN